MTTQPQPIPLLRDVQATRIPSGETITLPQATPVTITQSLGGSHTVHAASPPGLYRIANLDADALGITPEQPQTPTTHTTDGTINEDLIWATLKNCYDPEIPVNIVDLGLIYSMVLTPLDAGHRVEVKMTLTAPGCGMGPAIANDAKQKILALPGITEATVDIVWDPQWNPSMITPDGKKKLGIES